MKLPVHILVEKARAGDREAFEALFAETHVRIFNLFRANGMSREEAADLTQETYVKAWEKLDALREPHRFVTWLYQIARNSLRDYLKYRSRHPEAELDDASTVRSAASDGPGEVAESRFVSDRVREAVFALPEAQRLPVVMYYLHGTPVGEIARSLGVPFGTVLSRLARGRAALARKLAPLLDLEPGRLER